MDKEYYQTSHYAARKSIGYLIRYARNMLTDAVEALFATKELSLLQWIILMQLRDNIATTSAEICQHVRHDSGALTRIIDQLEQRKFLIRERSKKDRRMIFLQLTPLGLEIVESLIPVVVDFYNEMLADFTKEEVDSFIQFLMKLNTKLDHTAKAQRG